MKPQQRQTATPKTAGGALGTFAGVFTPSILTILGIILFLRLGFVVGSAGLARALVIICLANLISVLTSVSLAAVATNLKVKGGGDYYLISRTLGMEFGGAIGMVLFLAQSVSIGFYCIGFGEAVSAMFTTAGDRLPQIVALAAALFLFVLAWLGADWATRFQYVVMACLVMALVSFFVGGLWRWDPGQLARNWADPGSDMPFWVLFAIFFPAVTGFTQGVSMSGDLKDPGQSLPSGTFAAVGLSILVYFGVAVVFAAAMPAEAMRTDFSAMKQVAWYGPLIDAGVIAATLSSAMASFLGAPRILQSMASDRIVEFIVPFAKGAGPGNNPRRGVLLAGGIALATIALGQLNLIAQVVSMFFLISYGLLNYATYFEARSASPSFRPRFRYFNRRLSLAGFLACMGAMLAIDFKTGLIAIAVLAAIYQYLRHTAGPARWADSRRSYHLQRAIENLSAAAEVPGHPRNWRPNILALSNDDARRASLVGFADLITGSSGTITVVRILEDEGLKTHRLQEDVEKALQGDLSPFGPSVFPLVVIADDVGRALQVMIQSAGTGPLRVNTLLVNRPDQLARGTGGIGYLLYSRTLRQVHRLGCNVVVLSAEKDRWESLTRPRDARPRVDVWWQNDATSRLMLLFAHLVTRREEWDSAEIRVMTIATPGESDEAVSDTLRRILEDVRIPAEPCVVDDLSAESILRHSGSSDLVFLPLVIRDSRLAAPAGESVDRILPRLPVTALAMAAEDIDLDAAPEEGAAGDLAAALDAMARAEKRARKIEKEATRAAEVARQKLEALQSAVSTGDHEELKRLAKTMIDARRKAEETARRAAKAAALAEDALRTAEDLGGAKAVEKQSRGKDD